jgi:voltage-gated potassium channel
MRESMKELYVRAQRAFVLVLLVLAVGTFGFMLIGRGSWAIEDCLYMTVITISTVGYGEVIPVSDVPHGRLFAVLLILFGMGAILYFASSIVAIFVEGDLRNFWRRRKMEKAISHVEKHIIVCGCGTTGSLVIKELLATKTPFVVIERNEEKIHEVQERFKGTLLNYVRGNATDQEVLTHAGIERASGVIVGLPEDKDSLIVTITARQMNRNLRIVSKCQEPGYIPRIEKAGADSVVSPNAIGGMRLVSAMIRPTVVQFLDLMLRDKEKNLRIEQVEIGDNADIMGKKLSETRIRKITDLLVIAAQNRETGEYTYNPGPDFIVGRGTVLIVLGTMDDVIKLREACGI